MIRIAVCDDEQCFVEQIYTILSVQAKEISSALHISTYMDSGQLLYDVEDGAHFDLLFLDIEMPGTDGMSLAGAIRRSLPLALIVFITSHTKYAVKAFELSVFRYIPKPELAACLPLALKDACRLLERNSNGTYVIESPAGYARLQWMISSISIRTRNTLSLYLKMKNCPCEGPWSRCCQSCATRSATAVS